jgi:hypothetical protein
MAFRRALRRAGITGYSVHGLRKNAGVALADAGCDMREIMAILGHRTLCDGTALHQAGGSAPPRAIGYRQVGSGRKWQTPEHSRAEAVATLLIMRRIRVPVTTLERSINQRLAVATHLRIRRCAPRIFGASGNPYGLLK